MIKGGREQTEERAGKAYSTPRLRVMRAAVIIAILTNIVLSFVSMPNLLPSGGLFADTLGDIGRNYERSSGTGRGVCISFYEIYGAPSLTITQDAYAYLGLEDDVIRRYCRVSTLTKSEPDGLPASIEQDELGTDVMQFGPADSLRTARFLKAAPDEPANLVVAILRDGTLTFIPAVEKDS